MHSRGGSHKGGRGTEAQGRVPGEDSAPDPSPRRCSEPGYFSILASNAPFAAPLHPDCVCSTLRHRGAGWVVVNLSEFL